MAALLPTKVGGLTMTLWQPVAYKGGWVDNDIVAALLPTKVGGLTVTL